MKRLVALFVLLIVAPVATRADTGAIRGTVADAAKVKSIVAINREDDKKYTAKLDAKTGAFTIENLPLPAKFDLIVDHGIARLEGVNLKVPRSDYEVEQPLGKDDPAALKKEMAELNKFEDVIDVLAIKGNIQHAAVIVNKLRTMPFYDSKPGEIVWRLELWRFERPDESWIKTQDELFLVLYRERIQKSAYEKKSLTLDASIGGIELNEKSPTVEIGKVELPGEKPGVRYREAGKP